MDDAVKTFMRKNAGKLLYAPPSRDYLFSIVSGDEGYAYSERHAVWRYLGSLRAKRERFPYTCDMEI